MVFQGFNLVPRLDVLTNVLMGRLNHRGQWASLLGLFTAGERAMALQALERFDLADAALQRAGTLSGGQQQRVAICRALLQEPRLMLADEPIASLDPRNARVVMDALRRIHREDGLTVLVNLHHLDTARHHCDRIVALAAGRVAFDGTPLELTADRVRDVYGVSEDEFHDDAGRRAVPVRPAVAVVQGGRSRRGGRKREAVVDFGHGEIHPDFRHGNRAAWASQGKSPACRRTGDDRGEDAGLLHHDAAAKRGDGLVFVKLHRPVVLSGAGR